MDPARTDARLRWPAARSMVPLRPLVRDVVVIPATEAPEPPAAGAGWMERRGRPWATEVEHPERGRADVLDRGPPDGYAVVYEIETECTPKHEREGPACVPHAESPGDGPPTRPRTPVGVGHAMASRARSSERASPGDLE